MIFRITLIQLTNPGSSLLCFKNADNALPFNAPKYELDFKLSWNVRWLNLTLTTITEDLTHTWQTSKLFIYKTTVLFSVDVVAFFWKLILLIFWSDRTPVNHINTKSAQKFSYFANFDQRGEGEGGLAIQMVATGHWAPVLFHLTANLNGHNSLFIRYRWGCVFATQFIKDSREK